MAITTFPCPECQSPLSLEALPEGATECPQCRSRVPVPRLGLPAKPSVLDPLAQPRPGLLVEVRESTPRSRLPERRGSCSGRRVLQSVAVLAALVLFLGGGVFLAICCLNSTEAEADPLPVAALEPPPPRELPVVDATPAPLPEPEPAVVVPTPEKPPEPPRPAKKEPDRRKKPRPAPKSPEPPARKPDPPVPAAVARVNPTIAPGVTQRDVDDAIERGIRFLRAYHEQSAGWSGWGDHPVGPVALPGLTLLECKVPAGDPLVRDAARIVRDRAARLTKTYDLALAILFLDRLGERSDRPLIQSMALRLVAGQNAAGGWDYDCPVLDPDEKTELLTFLRKRRPEPKEGKLAPKPMPDAGKPIPKALFDPVLAARPGQNPAPMDPLKKPNDLPAGSLKPKDDAPLPANPLRLPGVPDKSPRDSSSSEAKGRLPEAPAEKKADAAPATPPAPSDLSLPGVKPVLPADKKAPGARPEFLPERLRNLPIVTRGKGKGLKPGGRDDNSNSQFALLGLWAARRHDVPTQLSIALAAERYKLTQFKNGSWGYHLFGEPKPSMTCVGLLGLAMGHGVSEKAGRQPPKAGRPPVEDRAVSLGLSCLAQFVGTPLSPRQPSRLENLYFLWSLERVAVLYDLKTIGGKDWYAWGAQLLVRTQNTIGSWESTHYPGSENPMFNTCFALLFLKRSNLVSDLTADLQYLLTTPDARSKNR